jgi:hypothetical protein
MNSQRRWENCIHHKGCEVKNFIGAYFDKPERKTVLIAGIGFDPRATIVCKLLAENIKNKVRGIFIREERPDPSNELVEQAANNSSKLKEILKDHEVIDVNIFAYDGAAVGGRNVVLEIDRINLADVTDIIVDFSSLSTGIAFPIVKLFYEKLNNREPSINLHLMVVDEPYIDAQIVPTASDITETIHGFKGGFGLYDNSRAAKLWLPQLIKGRSAILERIYNYVKPHDICPILPFPSSHPRLSDELIEEYADEFESIWNVDARNIVYAGENKPLDLYRTILKIDDARKSVFEETGGSMIILSPIGSKVLTIGALLASIERNFPVVHVESINYSIDFNNLSKMTDNFGEIMHIWLSGDIYGN